MAASTSRSKSCQRVDRFKDLCEKTTHIIHYLTTGTYVEGSTEGQKRVVRSQARNYMYDETRDKLYYTGCKANTKKKVVLEEGEALGLVERYHSSATGEHSGINATLAKISMHYTWNGVKQDITDFIKSCDRCQGRVNIKTQAQKSKVINTTQPLQPVGMDLIDYFSKGPSVMAASTSRSKSGHRVDRFRDLCEKTAPVMLYLTGGTFAEGLTEMQKRVVRCQSKNYSYDKTRDELYFTGNKADIKKKVVLQEDEALGLVEHYHSSETGEHSGIKATLTKMSKHYTWNGMKQDVAEFIKSCDHCQQRVNIKTQAPELKVIKTTEPLQLVRMDLIGPLPTTQDGFIYILTFTDYYTKFVELLPLKTKEASVISTCIQTFVWRWGAPKRFLLDQGRELVAKVNADLCKKLGIYRSVTSAYHPQTNGLDERSNQSLRTRLSKLVNDHQTDWNEYLDGVAYSIRTQKQSSTKQTPFFLMFGRHARTLLEMEDSDDELTLQIKDEIDHRDSDEAVSNSKEVMAASTSQKLHFHEYHGNRHTWNPN